MKKVICVLKMVPLLFSISIILACCILHNPIVVLIIVAATSLVILAYFSQLFEEGLKELWELTSIH